jgi:hypothetical protein
MTNRICLFSVLSEDENRTSKGIISGTEVTKDLHKLTAEQQEFLLQSIDNFKTQIKEIFEGKIKIK